MSKIAGIPRGLFFYRFYPFWKRFFDCLCVTTVVSPPSNKRIMDIGVSVCINEACLPVKLYHAHVLELKDKADYILVPRFISLSKNEYICPKFAGIPDMVRCSVSGLPELIDTEVNLRKSPGGAKAAAMSLGRMFVSDDRKIKSAYKEAVQSYQDFKHKFTEGLILEDLTKDKWRQQERHGLKILLLGHPYNVYDSFLNMNILNKISSLGCDCVTLEMFDESALRKNTCELAKPVFWEYGTNAVGAVYEAIRQADIDGIIYLMCFGCGIDSFISYLAERRIKQTSKIPFITVTLDEQSGQAGLETRLEAFIDTLKWRKNGTYISAYGQRSYID